ncbi:recombination regulator RecX [Streptacidiphilus carbonis]|uniref:recombination regulator RecX n=1 Tax=Streptacidiphilus carbonis TaxID=105422 RepID=UPI000A0675B0|nr:recombination regulator RecX [Streptacidiphilus carbonis]
MAGQQPERPERSARTSTREAWGPRDWCASGDGGEGFDLLPAAAGVDAGPDEYEEDDEAGYGTVAATGGEVGTATGRGSAGDSAESADPATRARAVCLRLLTGSAKTRKQLADAMRKREIPDDVAQEVLDRYEEVGLIDDSAFAGAWVESRHRGRGLARRALAMELRSRGVDNGVVAEAVAQLDPEQEAETARELVERKLRSTRGLERQVRIRRLAGMLARRGYSEGLALRVVRTALDREEQEEGEEGRLE